MSVPRLLHTVLDTDDVRATAEFWRQLLDLRYRPGDEVVTAGEDWLVLDDHDGNQRLAFQLIDHLQRSTWPAPGVPKQLHLDLTVGSVEELDEQHGRVLASAASCATTGRTRSRSRFARTPTRPATCSASSSGESRGPVPVDVGQHPRQHRADGREVRSPGPRRVGQFEQG